MIWLGQSSTASIVYYEHKANYIIALSLYEGSNAFMRPDLKLWRLGFAIIVGKDSDEKRVGWKVLRQKDNKYY